MKCAQCREHFPPALRGRRARYCCGACRQKAYRRRLTKNPHRWVSRLLKNDLDEMRDREERKRGAIRVLERMGFEVHLTRCEANRLKRDRPVLRVLSSDPEDEEPPTSA